MKKKKCFITGLVLFALTAALQQTQNISQVKASGDSSGMEETITSGTDTGSSSQGSNTLGQYSEEGVASEMLTGNTADVSFSAVSVSGSKAGGKVTISFTVTGNTNGKKHYQVENIERVYPTLEDSFPFVINDEAYRVTTGSGNTLSCSYTFQAKDNLETAYYNTSFTVVYSRKATDGKTTVYDSEYSVTKSFNVKLTAKPVTTAKPAATPKPKKTLPPEEKVGDGDLLLKMSNAPRGVYGGSCPIGFRVYSSKCTITSVMPVIDTNFPFVSTSEAYKVVRSKGAKSLNCHYAFQVKNNVSSGYQGVVFRITYLKNGQTLTTDKTVNVELVGKKTKKKKEKKESGKKSTPRVMVTGYTTDLKTVRPNDKFLLKLQIKNNASVTVRNVKFTLSTANGEFLPVSGASTAYVDSIGAKSTVEISFQMKAGASLSSKSYQVTVKSEYEDGKAESYSAEDNVSIPVVMQDRISLTDVTAPDSLTVDGSGDLSFSINNLGGGALSNVTVLCKGKDFTCEEAFVGNIAAGATGYANVTLMGTSATDQDSGGECRIIVKYENTSGESKRYTEKTNVYVFEEDMESEEVWDEESDTSEKQGLPLAGKIAIVIGLAVVVVLVIRFLLRRRRLKKEELLDDEFL